MTSVSEDKVFTYSGRGCADYVLLNFISSLNFFRKTRRRSMILLFIIKTTFIFMKFGYLPYVNNFRDHDFIFNERLILL